jgi:hypothetical protein
VETTARRALSVLIDQLAAPYTTAAPPPDRRLEPAAIAAPEALVPDALVPDALVPDALVPTQRLESAAAVAVDARAEPGAAAVPAAGQGSAAPAPAAVPVSRTVLPVGARSALLWRSRGA